MTLKDQIHEILGRIPYPGFRKSIVDAGVVRSVALVEDGIVQLELAFGVGTPAADEQAVREAIRVAVDPLPGVRQIAFRAAPRIGGAPSLKLAGERTSPATSGSLDAGLVPEVRSILAVASGKGGVGKSTVAVNLAIALARAGQRVGLLDADIYGPSIPIMTGLAGPPQLAATGRLAPFERFGLRVMSLGFLVDPQSAVIWRGPLVMKAVEQLLRDVDWGTLDILVVDMPPGTGDVQLTLSQRVRLAGALIVTTPQDVALADAIKAVAMFRRVEVPILGIVENMSYFRCPHCDERTAIFGSGGGRREAERLGVPFFGEIPLDPAIRMGGDLGEPVVAAVPEGPESLAFGEIAKKIIAVLGPPAAPAEDPASQTGTIFERFRRSFGRT